ncbi:hypothetical protein RJ640_021064 [Escallonia rubra]|uniref:Uncharacterized protein n=1 Tax=Escallonia rubra TaxID=112253 RepID=A0AA88QR29_9ASTE|nr:hypothetical protein RJ640_021064 [Escallonia rubra]
MGKHEFVLKEKAKNSKPKRSRTRMSATVVSEAMVMTAAESQQKSNNDVEFVKCDCCGLTEECTAPYIDNICERFNGRWICGLCGEAVKDKIV